MLWRLFPILAFFTTGPSREPCENNEACASFGQAPNSSSGARTAESAANPRQSIPVLDAPPSGADRGWPDLLTWRCRLNRNNFDFHAIRAANDGELYRISNGPLGKEPVNVIHTGYLTPINCYDDIAFPNTTA